jgi:hypothetical protein
VQNANGDIFPLSAPLNGFGSQQLAFSSSGTDDLLSLNIGAIQDFCDNPLQPTSGSFLRLGLEQTIPVGSGSIFGTRVRGSYSYFIPVRFINSFNLFETDIFKGQQSLAFNVQAGTVLGDLPPYDAFIVGVVTLYGVTPREKWVAVAVICKRRPNIVFPLSLLLGGVICRFRHYYWFPRRCPRLDPELSGIYPVPVSVTV